MQPSPIIQVTFWLVSQAIALRDTTLSEKYQHFISEQGGTHLKKLKLPNVSILFVNEDCVWYQVHKKIHTYYNHKIESLNAALKVGAITEKMTT